MILTRSEILNKIQSGEIVIEPFLEDMVGPASIDLALGNEIRIFENIDHSIPVTEDADFTKITKKIIINDKYTMKPNQLVLGITVESIILPGTIAGWLNSRSRFARLGLMVHATAPFIQPGIRGRQVLEIYNAGPNSLDLVPRQRLCQLILEECKGSARYEGHYTNQSL